ncbi:MAG TPA: acyl-CoA dehydrogenase family protein [Methylomirabilota bacterium]|nr:acyl-CoA dehydrogenase family protein [Methylomirabilota bacterium]
MAAHPVVDAVRAFVDTEVRPAAAGLEQADAYPHALVGRLRELGLFGALVPADYGGLGLDVATYARVVEELCRGWMSLAGVINSHTMAALIVLHDGTEEQRHRLLPRLARGEARGGLALTEPHAGSDVQAIRTVARRDGDGYRLSGTKMFVTNGREGNTFALLALTDPRAEPRHRGMSCFIVEKGDPGLRVASSIAKLGYKGVDTVELVLEDVAVPAANLVGGVEGRGFRQVMRGLETGRINIAARAVGVAQAAWESALGHLAATGAAPSPALPGMASRLAAARALTAWAAGMKDRSERCDLEAGLAKLHASEAAQAVAAAALALHGEAGTRARGDVERLYRDTPLMLIGEGTNEIQRTLIARQLVERHGEKLGGLVSRAGEPEDRRQAVLAMRQLVDKSLATAAGADEAAARCPAAVLEQLAGLGLLGALVPAERGGLGLDLLTCVMLLEELARGSATVAALVGAHLTATALLAGDGAPDGAERLLAAMARGEALGALALGGAVRARRERGELLLAGDAGLVAAGARAGLVLVRARTDDGRALCAALPRGTPGAAVGEAEATLGLRGAAACALALDGARLPVHAVLGAADIREEEAVEAALALARLTGAAVAVGLAQAAFEAALRYAQQRTAFGKPIYEHQAVQLKLADMAARVTAARRLAYRAAETAGPDGIACALAWLDAADAAREVTLESMRVHGGYGYTTEFPVERYYRDAAQLAAAGHTGPLDLAALAHLLATRRDV